MQDQGPALQERVAELQAEQPLEEQEWGSFPQGQPLSQAAAALPDLNDVATNAASDDEAVAAVDAVLSQQVIMCSLFFI